MATEPPLVREARTRGPAGAQLRSPGGGTSAAEPPLRRDQRAPRAGGHLSAARVSAALAARDPRHRADALRAPLSRDRAPGGRRPAGAGGGEHRPGPRAEARQHGDRGLRGRASTGPGIAQPGRWDLARAGSRQRHGGGLGLLQPGPPSSLADRDQRGARDGGPGAQRGRPPARVPGRRGHGRERGAGGLVRRRGDGPLGPARTRPAAVGRPQRAGRWPLRGAGAEHRATGDAETRAPRAAPSCSPTSRAAPRGRRDGGRPTGGGVLLRVEPDLLPGRGGSDQLAAPARPPRADLSARLRAERGAARARRAGGHPRGRAPATSRRTS